MHIILDAGDARALATQALEDLKRFDADAARSKMAQAQDKIVSAHRYQTDAIVDETRGVPAEYSVLFCHAQDTLMTINMEMDLVNHMIDLTEALDRRIKDLESR